MKRPLPPTGGSGARDGDRALTARWVETWRRAGPELERIRRQELRALDTYRALELLYGAEDGSWTPSPPRPSSGLVEQQRWFMRARRHF